MVRLLHGRNGLSRGTGAEASGSRSAVEKETTDGVETTRPAEVQVTRMVTTSGLGSLCKTKGKVVAMAAGSEKDPQAVTDTKAKRTSLEVILGDNSGLGKKEQRDVGKHDLEKATKPQSKAKPNIAGIQEKASFIEREETRLAELEIVENEGRTVSKHGHERKTGHRCEY